METTLRRRLRAKLFLASAHPRAKDAERYRKAARYSLVRVLPVVGAIPLSKLRRRDLEGLRDKLMVRYKPNTLAAALSPLAAALTWAMRQELIPLSPMVGLKLPRKTSSTDRLSAEETGRLPELARSQRTDAMRQTRYVAVCLALRLGLRFGEIFGLRWGDIELPRRRVTVARSFDRTPKSGEPRTVPLPAPLVDELAQWRTCPSLISVDTSSGRKPRYIRCSRSWVREKTIPKNSRLRRFDWCRTARGTYTCGNA